MPALFGEFLAAASEHTDAAVSFFGDLSDDAARELIDARDRMITAIARYADALTPRHHTRLAVRSDALFSDDAAAFIHRTARGYPRAVNRLAVAALLATYTTHKTIADEAAARAAAAEVSDQ